MDIMTLVGKKKSLKKRFGDGGGGGVHVLDKSVYSSVKTRLFKLNIEKHEIKKVASKPATSFYVVIFSNTSFSIESLVYKLTKVNNTNKTMSDGCNFFIAGHVILYLI